MRQIILLRHFESQKNVEDRHGGDGNRLTALGVLQAEKTAEYLLASYSIAPASSLLIGHNVIQVKESVELLSQRLNVLPNWDERLRGISLGHLSGLSRSEASQKYPEAAARLDLWRQGKLRADDLNLPGGESFLSFEARIRLLIDEWVNLPYESIIAVCSRSTLIMLVNLIQLGLNFDYSVYKSFDFSSGSITEIFSDEKRFLSLGKVNYALL